MNSSVRHLDLLFSGGPIYSSEGAPRPEAVGIAGGHMLVGRFDELRDLADAKTEQVGLNGRLLLPGFIDAHAHPVAGGLERLRCDLTEGSTREEYLEKVGDYAATSSDGEWILGGGWNMSVFPGGRPTAIELDEVTGDRPAFLYNKDHHGAWANSAALARAGVDASTSDPPDGAIERDGEGNPTGMLHDGAMALVERLLPTASDEDLMRGLLEGQRYMHSYGITGWIDAIVGPEFLTRSTLPTYLEATRSGTLKARVRGSLWLPRDATLDSLEELEALREEARAVGFDAESIKIMQDGVVESFTAAMIDPYLDGEGEASDNRGPSFFDPEFLQEFVPRADAAGFQVHFHAIGDRAVRECLDAVDAARRVNGMNDLRHHIAHIQVVHPDDVPRFAALGVIGNAQPLWASLEPQMRELNVPFLGEERTTWQYPFGSILRSGGRLAFGSDWPVSTADPFAGMHVAVHRTEPPSEADGEPTEDPLVASESIDVGTAIDTYTKGSAFVSRLEHSVGEIADGRSADLAVVDRDISDPNVALDGAKVEMTVVSGQVVFGR